MGYVFVTGWSVSGFEVKLQQVWTLADLHIRFDVWNLFDGFEFFRWFCLAYAGLCLTVWWVWRFHRFGFVRSQASMLGLCRLLLFDVWFQLAGYALTVMWGFRPLYLFLLLFLGWMLVYFCLVIWWEFCYPLWTVFVLFVYLFPYPLPKPKAWKPASISLFFSLCSTTGYYNMILFVLFLKGSLDGKWWFRVSLLAYHFSASLSSFCALSFLWYLFQILLWQLG